MRKHLNFLESDDDITHCASNTVDNKTKTSVHKSRCFVVRYFFLFGNWLAILIWILNSGFSGNQMQINASSTRVVDILTLLHVHHIPFSS